MAERVYLDDNGTVAVWMYTTAAPHVVWLDWRTDPGDLAVDAVSHALRWAFSHGYRRVETAIPVTDRTALSTAAVVGLRREGVCRAAAWMGGEDVDLVRVSRLVSDVDPVADALPTLASSFHRSLIAAGLIICDRAGRVLLLQTSYKPEWEIPGGIAEPGEGPLATVRREAQEEIGVTSDVGDLLLIQSTPATDRRPDLLAMIFDGGTQDIDFPDTLRFADGEITAACWCDAEQIRRRASPLLAGRILTILAARSDGRLPGTTLVLE